MRIRLVVLMLSVTASVSAQPATVVGAVIDSIDGGPLANAVVFVSGTGVRTIADSTGHFRLDSVPPGDYAIGVSHPLLDSVGIAVKTGALTLSAGATRTVVLATPSVARLIALACPDAASPGATAIIGRALAGDGDEPATGATVRLSWTTFDVNRHVGVQHTTYSHESPVAPSGDYRICALPAGFIGTLRAVHGDVQTDEIPIDLARRPLALVTLRLAAVGSVGAVSGHVVDARGAPVSGAQIITAGMTRATTGDSGTFAVRDVPAGSRTFRALRLGYQTTEVVVEVSATQPTTLTLTLRPPATALDTVRLARDAMLSRVGFTTRRQAGVGYFLDVDDIAKRNVGEFGDLVRTIPALYSDRSPGCGYISLDGSGAYPLAPGMRTNLAIRLGRVLGVEVYRPTEKPPPFVHVVHCTVVVIWTVESLRESPN